MLWHKRENDTYCIFGWISFGDGIPGGIMVPCQYCWLGKFHSWRTGERGE